MESSILRGTKARLLSGFCYPKVVETSISFKDFVNSLCVDYPWSHGNVVYIKYFNSSEEIFVPLTCDEHLGYLFGLNAGTSFGTIHIEVLQPPKECEKGKGVHISNNSANSECPCAPRRPKPSKPTASC